MARSTQRTGWHGYFTNIDPRPEVVDNRAFNLRHGQHLAGQRPARTLAALGLLDVARRARQRLRALGTTGLDLPAPDYQRIDVATLLRRPAAR